jgi:hypothetical protein
MKLESTIFLAEKREPPASHRVMTAIIQLIVVRGVCVPFGMQMHKMYLRLNLHTPTQTSARVGCLVICI